MYSYTTFVTKCCAAPNNISSVYNVAVRPGSQYDAGTSIASRVSGNRLDFYSNALRH